MPKFSPRSRVAWLIAAALVVVSVVGPAAAEADIASQRIDTAGVTGPSGAPAWWARAGVVDAAFGRAVSLPRAPGPAFLLALPRGARLATFDPRADTVKVVAKAPAPKAKPAPKHKVAAPRQTAPAPRWVGRNHVWMPSLGISRAVYSYPCSWSRPLENVVYRWGCAGYNNVYLMGHAWGVFKALHDSYYNGRLHVGMVVVYADSYGRSRIYRVTTWRVVRPEDSEWAIASQRRPSMTLQTCVGKYGQYRLNVRLIGDPGYL